MSDTNKTLLVLDTFCIFLVEGFQVIPHFIYLVSLYLSTSQIKTRIEQHWFTSTIQKVFLYGIAIQAPSSSRWSIILIAWWRIWRKSHESHHHLAKTYFCNKCYIFKRRVMMIDYDCDSCYMSFPNIWSPFPCTQMNGRKYSFTHHAHSHTYTHTPYTPTPAHVFY